MFYKAERTTRNTNNTFGPGTAKECTVWWWFKKLCKGDKSLEDEKCLPLEVDNDNWEPSSKLIFLQLHKKLLKNSMSTILQLFGIWSKLERWKSLISGCLMSWPKTVKIVILRCHFLLFYTTTTNHFLIGLWCVTKSGLYVTTKDDQLSRRTEKKLRRTSQSQTCTKKGHSHCLVVACLSDPLQLSESNETVTSEKYAQ